MREATVRDQGDGEGGESMTDIDRDHALALAEDWCRREGVLDPEFEVDLAILDDAAQRLTTICWLLAFKAAYLTLTDKEVLDARRLEEHGEAARSLVGAKKGDYYMTLRIAVLGKKETPPLFGSMATLAELWGRAEVESRLDAALAKLR